MALDELANMLGYHGNNPKVFFEGVLRLNQGPLDQN